MFRKDQFGLVFNTIFSLAFSAALTAFVKFTQGTLSLETFCMGMVPSFCINFVLGTFIPLVKVGNGFASIFVRDEQHPAFYFLRMLAIVVIMTVSMSFLVMFSEMGFQKLLLIAFAASLPKTLLFAYIVGCLIFPVLLKITKKLCVK